MTAAFSPSTQLAGVTIFQVACLRGTMADTPIMSGLMAGTPVMVGLMADTPIMSGLMATPPIMLGRWQKGVCGMQTARLLPRDVAFEFSQNNNPIVQVQIADDAGNLTDTADITALEWRLAANNKSAALLSKSLVDFTTVNATTWQIQLSAVETASLLAARYHEMTATDTSGNVRTIIAGPVRCVDRIVGD